MVLEIALLKEDDVKGESLHGMHNTKEAMKYMPYNIAERKRAPTYTLFINHRPESTKSPLYKTLLLLAAGAKKTLLPLCMPL